MEGVLAMSAIEQIIKWAQSLPGWQADAVRRFLEQGELTQEDRTQLYQMLKVSGGIDKESMAPAFPQVGAFSGTGKGQQRFRATPSTEDTASPCLGTSHSCSPAGTPEY
jgi:hypothetical protein